MTSGSRIPTREVVGGDLTNAERAPIDEVWRALEVHVVRCLCGSLVVKAS